MTLFLQTLMGHNNSIVCVIAVLAFSSFTVCGQSDLTLDWGIVDGVGGVSENGGISIVATTSREDASQMDGNGGLSIGSLFSEPPMSGTISTLALPLLRIEIATNNIVVRWSDVFPTNWWQLAWAGALNGGDASWNPNFLPAPVLDNGEYRVALPLSRATQFFRLQFNGYLAVSFAAVPGYDYTVQSAPSLTPPVAWSNLSTNTGSNFVTAVSVTDTNIASQMFYQLKRSASP